MILLLTQVQYKSHTLVGVTMLALLGGYTLYPPT